MAEEAADEAVTAAAAARRRRKRALDAATSASALTLLTLDYPDAGMLLGGGNPNHDPTNGRFTTGPGGLGGFHAAAAGGARRKAAPKAGGKAGGKAAPKAGGAAKPKAAPKAKAAPKRKPVDMDKHAAEQAKRKAKQDKYDADYAKKEARLKKAYDNAVKDKGRERDRLRQADRAERAGRGARRNEQYYKDLMNDPAWQGRHPDPADRARYQRALDHYRVEAEKYEAKGAKQRALILKATQRHDAAKQAWEAHVMAGPKAVHKAPMTPDFHLRTKAREAARQQKEAERQAKIAEAARQKAEKARIAEEARKSKAMVTPSDDGQTWHGGLKTDHPPFTPDEFRAAMKNAVVNPNRGINQADIVSINGEKYIIKSVNARAIMGGHGEHWAKPEGSGERYETHAEAASPRIAKEIGLGKSMIQETYAFADGAQHYVALKMYANAASYHGDRGAFLKVATPKMMHDLNLMEYMAGDPDRHGGNIMVADLPGGGRGVLTIDHGRSYRANFADSNMIGWPPDARAIWRNVMPKDKHGAPKADTAYSRPALERIVRSEARAVAVMKRYHLEPGIVGFQSRVEAIRRALADHPNDKTISQSSIDRRGMQVDRDRRNLWNVKQPQQP